jgi:hypothetical protein
MLGSPKSRWMLPCPSNTSALDLTQKRSPWRGDWRHNCLKSYGERGVLSDFGISCSIFWGHGHTHKQVCLEGIDASKKKSHGWQFAIGFGWPTVLRKKDGPIAVFALFTSKLKRWRRTFSPIASSPRDFGGLSRISLGYRLLERMSGLRTSTPKRGGWRWFPLQWLLSPCLWVGQFGRSVM